MDGSTFVVIHGYDTSIMSGARSVNDYVANIVYGNPKITGVAVGKPGKFVALCEFDGTQDTAARYTFERMGSFSHGAQFILDRRIALQEFGTWVEYNAESREAVTADAAV